MTTPFTTSEPTRLREEHGEDSSSLERALIRAGSSNKTSPQTRAKEQAGLGLAAGSSALLTPRSGSPSRNATTRRALTRRAHTSA